MSAKYAVFNQVNMFKSNNDHIEYRDQNKNHLKQKDFIHDPLHLILGYFSLGSILIRKKNQIIPKKLHDFAR